MVTHAEKRTHERHCFSGDIAFTYFNNAHFRNAQILNVGAGGMCFKSNSFLTPGAAVCLHLKRANSTGTCEGLHSVALANVKWCSQLPGDNPSPYSVGVKYFNPVY